MSSTRDTLIETLAAERDGMVDLTRDLIAIPSENPPGMHYHDALELLRSRLEALGFDDTRIEGDCIVSFAGSGTRTVYFSGHYDVVPAQRRDQFTPRLHGKTIVGRGSSDMKSGLAAMTYAARALRELRLLENGRVGLVFVPDEETAGPRGSRYLAARELLGADGVGMLTPEPTGGVVWNANRGAITLRVTARGKTAHVGRQHEGVNAFEGMLIVAQALQELKHEVERHTTAFHIAPDIARRSILMLGGRAEGGTNFNAVPDECWFTVDRPLNPEEDFEVEKQRLFDVIDRARGPATIEVEVIQEGRASGSDENGPLGRALAESIVEVTGRPARFELCPGLLTVSHGPDEFVPIDRIVECSQVYALTVARLFDTG